MQDYEAFGLWYVSEKLYDVNYSEILSKLIENAGRFCEHHSSDLFTYWKYEVDEYLKVRDNDRKDILLGVREYGIDCWTNLRTSSIFETRHKHDRCSYRKIFRITIEKQWGNITMRMSEVSYYAAKQIIGDTEAE